MFRASITAMPPDEGGDADTMRAPWYSPISGLRLHDLVIRQILQRPNARRSPPDACHQIGRHGAFVKSLRTSVGDGLESIRQVRLFDDGAERGHGAIPAVRNTFAASGERSIRSRLKRRPPCKRA